MRATVASGSKPENQPVTLVPARTRCGVIKCIWGPQIGPADAEGVEVGPGIVVGPGVGVAATSVGVDVAVAVGLDVAVAVDVPVGVGVGAAGAITSDPATRPTPGPAPIAMASTGMAKNAIPDRCDRVIPAPSGFDSPPASLSTDAIEEFVIARPRTNLGAHRRLQRHPLRWGRTVAASALHSGRRGCVEKCSCSL